MDILILILQLICLILAIIYFYLSINKSDGKATFKEDPQEICRIMSLRQVHLTPPLSERTRPVHIDEIIGQEQAIRALRAALCSPCPQHIIIYGPSGVGKTAAARIILEEAKRDSRSPFKKDAPFVEIDATTLQFDQRSIADPLIGSVHDPIYQGAGTFGAAGIPQPKEGAVTKAHGGVLFLDEIGELEPCQMNRLLKVLEDRKVFFNSSYYSRHNKNIPSYIHDIFKNGLPADFRLIGATTKSPNDIPPALRSRCCEIFFKPLNIQNMAVIAENAIKKTGFDYDKKVVEEISLYSHSGRDTVALVEKAAGLAYIDGIKQITLPLVKEAAENGKYSKINYKISKGKKYTGKVKGLGVWNMQGTVIDIETSVIKTKGNGRFEICGLSQSEEINTPRGKLIRKSTAYSSAENALALIQSVTGININDHIIHLNITGGMPLDGPSAGVAIFCCMYSALFGVPVSDKIAFTGEISLWGNVLPVGGIREKLQGAFLSGIEKVIIPKDNYTPTLEDTGVEIIAAENIEQVIRIVFGNAEENIV